jgi:hypothetical protein
VWDKEAVGQVFLRVLWFYLSTWFHRCSPYFYITWEIKNRSFGGRSCCSSIDMKNNVYGAKPCLWLYFGRDLFI